ncbi:MAG: hypothetical protein OIF32_01305 [Campylobacterales bacterium]|nr:hypothetical protein [Campylobacterales bacterium]
MKLLISFVLGVVFTATTLSAEAQCGTENLENSEFYKFVKEFGVLNVNRGYKSTNKAMKRRAKKLGYYAKVDEVKAALSDNDESTMVIDNRTKAEQEALTLKGALKANLRGFNKAFDGKKSSEIKSVYSFCRTGTDQATDLVGLQFLFQGKAKIFGIADMAKACYPMVSKSGNVLNAKLNAKKVYVQKAEDGNYYEVNCPEVAEANTPIDVFSQGDVEYAEEENEPLPETMTLTNKKLDESVEVYKGSDNKYYKTKPSKSWFSF